MNEDAAIRLREYVEENEYAINHTPMRIITSILMAMLAFAGAACMENNDCKLRSGNLPEIEARQTDMMPAAQYLVQAISQRYL